MRKTVLGTVVAAMALSTGPARAGDLVFFHTPSKNIYCLAAPAEDTLPASVACDILEITRRTVNIPQPADCEYDWGNRFELPKRGKAGLSCYSDALMSDESQTLGYGKSLEFEGITCTSRQKGLTCVNASGHGFFLSKALQDIY